ncbi:MAG: hypothetical protein HYS13_25680 [Planctomycetia bacterium]|nr:hypothetical protein [Planctomycetia bacterium]
MSCLSEADAFALYSCHGEVWRALSADDRCFWSDEIKAGPTNLTQEFVFAPHVVHLENGAEALIARATDAVRKATATN